MGILSAFGMENEGGGLLGGLGRTLRDAAPMMSAYGNGQDMGTAQVRSQQMQETRHKRQEEENQQKVADQLAQKMGLPPGMGAEHVFGLYKAQKLADMAKQNREPRQLSFEERLYNDMGPEERQRYKESKIGGGRQTLSDQIAEREAAAARIGITKDHPAYPSFVGTGRMPREDQAPLTATDKKAILEADEGVMSGESAMEALAKAKELSPKAYEGPLAAQRGYVTGNMGYQDGKDTMELDNVVTTNALNSMNAIFGGNPTEGERKILLEIQGASNQPRSVRDSIFQRAEALVQRRLQFNRQRASEMRGGTFYGQGGRSAPAAPNAPPPAPGAVDLKKKYGLE
jgi:hypothetical protein